MDGKSCPKSCPKLVSHLNRFICLKVLLILYLIYLSFESIKRLFDCILKSFLYFIKTFSNFNPIFVFVLIFAIFVTISAEDMSDYQLITKAKVVFTVNNFDEDQYLTRSDAFWLAFNKWQIHLYGYYYGSQRLDRYLSVRLFCCQKNTSIITRGLFHTFLIDSESNNHFWSEDTIDVKSFGTTAVCPIVKTEELTKLKDKLFPNNCLKIGVYITLYCLTSHLDNCFGYRNGFNVEECNDLTIICGQKRLFVSKERLISRSKVFKRMFDNEMMEQLTNVLVIEDIDEEVVEEFVKYLYFYNSDKLEAFKEELLYMSDKYEVWDLKNICQNLIFIEIEPKNAIKLLLTFDKFNCIQMKTKTIEFISRNLSEIRIQSMTEWLELIRSDYRLADEIFKKMSEIIDKQLRHSATTDTRVFAYDYISY